uniref:enoyl-[acyl-carrier-protein] reductase n=1 Tax=Mycena chlorophos TaxID=658473 RepID=A0ABQ0KXM0_MYCCL|nr:predicted protein [Mycena chlorophos]
MLRGLSRAIVYTQTGDPTSVLSARTFSLPPPAPGTLNVKLLLAPINPADINVVQGVYPARPSLEALPDSAPTDQLFVAGNEGVAQVTHVASDVAGLNVGDWVIMTKPQSGTWASARQLRLDDVLKIPREAGEVHAATITVNPPTAWNMLNNFVHLNEGDFVVQNGANSAVGQAVIQIAAARGLKTLNFVRNRPDFPDLASKLKALGATEVLTYDDLTDRALVKTIMQDWTAGKGIRLGLNCVGGKDTTNMMRLLGEDAFLVSYGAMSREPLTLPTSPFIFSNLTCTGYWQARWSKTHSREDKESLMKSLVDLIVAGKLKEPEHEILTIGAQDPDEVAAQKVRDIMSKLLKGQYGKKVLLNMESPV